MDSRNRCRWWRAGLSIAAVTVAVLSAADAGCRPRKKLIQWGWDEPDTAFLRSHVREMEKTPFDGCVFGARYGSQGRGGSFTWEFWGRRRFERTELTNAFADLRVTRLRRFRDCFLRINVTPGDLDWFDDFSSVISNACLAGELARAGRARGILLDVEQYRSHLFEYRDQRLASSQTWLDYARCVRRRGRELMTAFQDGDPDLTVFLTFGYTLPWVLSEHGRRPLSDSPYGLLAPFLDGMLEAVRGRSELVDGYELSYGFRDSRQFMDARRLFGTPVLAIVADPTSYRDRVRLGFGLWLDYDWRRYGWGAPETARNYFSPEAFEASLTDALRFTDEYVWVYSERPRWWGSSDPAVRVPEPYVAALRRARKNGR